MGKVINYYKRMKSGLYIVYLDRMALYDKNNSGNYVYSTYINNEGEMITMDANKSEYIETGLSILGMIEVHKKGYSIGIKNISNIKEIVETIYNHITACIEAKRNNVFQQFTVDVNDLIDMEEFMLSILEANPIMVQELFKDELVKEMLSGGLMSIFSEDSVVEVRENELDVFRRVSKPADIDISMTDLLNTF
jgi:hypothetical protein